ncbi:hypothetical protein F4777DRAFT_547326 [Nemania sp. FL0916]|nr:hypothetical protein F4777DRAFT_547326 [Nemania sp. FL0916]
MVSFSNIVDNASNGVSGSKSAASLASQQHPVPSALLAFIRTYSPYYRSFLSHLPENAPFSDIPVTDVAAFWGSAKADRASIQTGPFRDGVVMRSAASTGAPKLVFMTREELRRIGVIKATRASACSGMLPGDIIANLSPMGGMYGSFVWNHTGITEMPIDNVQLPIGGLQPADMVIDIIEEFDATVILSTLYSVTKVANYLLEHGRTLPSVRLILYSGEQFFKDVRLLWNKAYPNALIAPYLYGTVECGPIGMPVHGPRPNGDDDINPSYKVLEPAVHMEIVDEDGKPIVTAGVKGSVVVTHLIKRLQPLLRYPAGDIAAWDDYEQKTFRLYGRESVCLKISNVALDLPFLKSLVADHITPDAVFQSVVRRTEGQNLLVLRVVCPKPENAAEIRDAIEDHLMNVSFSWPLNREAGTIGPVEVEYVEFKDLILSATSGKVKNFVEERF